MTGPDTTGPGGPTADEHRAGDRSLADVPVDSGWLDRLVDLHVLAGNGDAAAATAAKRWLDQDDVARRVWNQVQHICDRVRAAQGPS